MTDRPTGPATAAGDALFEWLDPLMWETGGDQMAAQFVDDIILIESEAVAAERARIFAALPEALAKAFEDYDLIDFGTDPHGFPVDDSTAAAALVAAIEKELR